MISASFELPAGCVITAGPTCCASDFQGATDQIGGKSDEKSQVKGHVSNLALSYGVGSNPFGDSKFTDHNWGVVNVLKSVAAELERPAAEVALAWGMARPSVTSTLIGASKASQIESNIAATDIVLTSDQIASLSSTSAIAPGFSASLTSPGIRRMVFGGNSVTG